MKDSLMYRFEGSEEHSRTALPNSVERERKRPGGRAIRRISRPEHWIAKQYSAKTYLENLILKNAKRNREIEIKTLDWFPVITSQELEILASVKRARVGKAKLEHSS